MRWLRLGDPRCINPQPHCSSKIVHIGVSLVSLVSLYFHSLVKVLGLRVCSCPSPDSPIRLLSPLRFVLDVTVSGIPLDPPGTGRTQGLGSNINYRANSFLLGSVMNGEFSTRSSRWVCWVIGSTSSDCPWAVAAWDWIGLDGSFFGGMIERNRIYWRRSVTID